MSAPKLVTALEYEECLNVFQQFEDQHPEVKCRSDFLGITIVNEDAGSILKLTVTQAGQADFIKATQLPKEFPVKLGDQDSFIKLVIYAAPILTCMAPKSNNRRPIAAPQNASTAPLNNPSPITAPGSMAEAEEDL